MLYNLIASPLVSIRFWETYLSADDRKRLGDNWRKAHYQDHLTAGMWMRLHGVTPVQATVAIALQLNYVSELSGRRALIDLGEDTNDPEITLNNAIAAGNLVIISQPRKIYWRGKVIVLDWEKRGKLWNYFYELCRHSQAGSTIDYMAFGRKASRTYPTQQKSRLTLSQGFPQDLAGLIVISPGNNSSFLLS